MKSSPGVDPNPHFSPILDSTVHCVFARTTSASTLMSFAMERAQRAPRNRALYVGIYVCQQLFTDGSYTKGARAHTHRELIREWLWETKGSSLGYIKVLEGGVDAATLVVALSPGQHRAFVIYCKDYFGVAADVVCYGKSLAVGPKQSHICRDIRVASTAHNIGLLLFTARR